MFASAAEAAAVGGGTFKAHALSATAARIDTRHRDRNPRLPVFIPFAAACGPQEDSHINAAADAPAHAAVRRRLVAILKAAALKST